MKKLQIAILCLLSIFVLMFASNVAAYDAAYTHIEHSGAATDPTIDGTYAAGAGSEWVVSLVVPFGTNGYWRDQWSMNNGIHAFLLAETTDGTNDAGDYWELCFDGNADGTTAPQSDDHKVRITGHGASQTVQWYVGTGSAWQTMTAPATESVSFAEGLGASPKIAADHYVLEMAILKSSTDMPLSIQWAFRVAYNDAATGGNGLQVWPPSTTDTNPDGWGYIDYSSDPNPEPDVIPEGIGLMAVIALSSVAVIAGSVLLRKRSIAKLASKHTVEI
jgi:hypothetical protein